MEIKKTICALVASVFLFHCALLQVEALERQPYESGPEGIVLRASGQFSVTIPANKIGSADMQFSLAAGERVTINASYFPTDAMVDFGLVDSDDIFHYVSASNGTINQTIRISEQGNYIFAIRNNSSYTVSVSGFVNY